MTKSKSIIHAVHLYHYLSWQLLYWFYICSQSPSQESTQHLSFSHEKICPHLSYSMENQQYIVMHGEGVTSASSRSVWTAEITWDLIMGMLNECYIKIQVSKFCIWLQNIYIKLTSYSLEEFFMKQFCKWKSVLHMVIALLFWEFLKTHVYCREW